MSDLAWIDLALRSVRPRAIAALLRYFRDLDVAEEAFQEASLAALKKWPQKGPPRDAAAWLIFVGRNAAIDVSRRRRREEALPDESTLSDREDAETKAAERLDAADYRDDILRLLFVCCHPELPATQQIALALRIVCGLTVQQIARAFVVSESAMEQRITRAKNRVAAADVPFEPPASSERVERVSIVAAVLYLMFNEGYSATGSQAYTRGPLCDESIRLTRMLLELFEGDPEIMGLLALMLIQHSRRLARIDASGSVVLLEEQDRRLWDKQLIAEGLALLDAAMKCRCTGSYQLQGAIAATHARAARPEDTDWAQIDALYRTLERLQPSPVITLNRAVAVSKLEGAEAALSIVEPLGTQLAAYFNFHGVRGALLLQLDRHEEARAAFQRAIGLANTPAEAAHIRMQLDRLQKDYRRGRPGLRSLR
ncbi:MAG TPA: RNA polymerase sigma factor [Polyangiales bacterium]|nr:RNA polymerase sigma factor [Polyangiales bacterium]